MKTKITLLLLLAASCFGQTNSYEKFLHNGRYLAFIEAPKSFLTTPIPVGVKWSSKLADEVNEHGYSFMEQKTLGEYIFPHMTTDLGDTVIILLAAMEAPYYRRQGVTADDLNEWSQYLTAHGFSFDKWLTFEERNARIAAVIPQEEN